MFHSWETTGGTVRVAHSNRARHITVIGAGPVAQKFARLMSAAEPAACITLVGDEYPYDRTQLIHPVDGTRDAATLELPPPSGRFEFMLGHVTAVDPDANQVSIRRADGQVNQLAHDALVFATGAEARRPDLPGIEHAHMFRRLHDVQTLLATQPRRVVVLGGGVLGVELAHAFRRRGCEVVLVHSGPHLMDRQLDLQAGRTLAKALYAEGIGLRLDTQVTAIEPGRVKTPENTMVCDAVVVVAGSVANDQLASASGLVCENGIVVDDDLCSSHPNIHAIGDCVHHDGQPGGLLSAGYEHAHIVAKCLSGQSRWAPCTSPAVVLKTSHGLVSFGVQQGQALTWQSPTCLRKLWLDGGRLVGVIVIGGCDELPRLRDAVAGAAPVAPWRRWMFRWGGCLWPDQQADPAA
jgi:nitrite reductase (NADH) large subunit